jgi:alkylresorcinol/alkylpyrone synthase
VVLAGGELELPGARPDAADPRDPLRLLSSHGVGHGLDIVDTGFKIVLSAKVPEVIEAHLGQDVDPLLSEHGLDRSRIDHWGAHT